MVEPQSFSHGVDRFLHVIRPHGRERTAFPRDLNAADSRRGRGETLHAWFVRLVDKYCPHDPAIVGIEEGIGIFANFGWGKNRLVYASVPTLIVPGGTLEDF